MASFNRNTTKSKYVNYNKYYATRVQEQPNLSVKYETTVYKLQSLAKESCD